jgi:hypothetical protein
MVYRATEEVVQRVMPLLELLAHRTIDKARLLQYLSARAGIDWGVLELIEERIEPRGDCDSDAVTLVVRDRAANEVREIPRPGSLPLALDGLVRDEYKRLATAPPLSMMAEPLFVALFGETHCSRCRWQGLDHAQVQRECRYAGRPVNFEPEDVGG